MANQYCPLCGGKNNCSMAKGEKDLVCWCTKEVFPKGIFDLVPSESKGKHCICRTCVVKYREEMGYAFKK